MHLYVHVPYCAAKCPYCDFNSVAGRNQEFASYVEALLVELKQVPPGPYDTIFMGGGTPSILPADMLARLCSGIAETIHLSDGYEWTMEANPGAVDIERFQTVRRHGVNRLSLGVQSIHDHHLRFLGRIHSAAEAERALSLALDIFPRVSADMMIGLPEQTLNEVEAEVDWYRRYGLRHASIYHLAYESGTEFYARRQRGELHEIAEDQSVAMLDAVADGLAALGMAAYETSNYATLGEESRHNLAYWRQADYYAIGAGAVSTVNGLRQTRQPHPGRYIAAVTGSEDLIWKNEILSSEDVLSECWMLGLRLREGVSEQRLLLLGDAEARWAPVVENLAGFGLLTRQAGRIALTPAGRRVQDAVTVALLPEVSQHF